MRATALVFLLACGGSTTPRAPAESGGPPASLVAMPASTDDLQVASVNGKPVYASCVTTQAARGASKQDALQQCIDFELLAQQAAAFATDPEVILQTRTALVSQVIAREYEDKYTKPADFGPYWDRIIDKNRRIFDHGEARASAYLRIPVAKDATPDQDATAHALANELAQKLASERGLMASHLKDIGVGVVGARAKLEFQVVPAYLDNGGLVDPYAKPLFAIPEVGRTTQAVRTPWGWDVILLTELIPAAHPTGDALVAQVLPDVKRSYFTQWATQIAQQLGVSIKLYDDKLPLLEDI